MGELLEMDILSCPLYDGAQAASTSARMASRITGRSEVLIPRQMNPEISLVMKNYLKPSISVKQVDFDPATGLMDIEDLMEKISSKTAAVMLENPSYLGILESEAEEIGKIARDRRAEFIVYQQTLSPSASSHPRPATAPRSPAGTSIRSASPW